MSAELALLALERRVLQRGPVARWLATVDELRVLLALGDTDAVVRLLLAIGAPPVEAAAVAAALDAFKAGALDAATIAEEGGIDGVSRRGRPSRAALAPAVGLDRDGRTALAQARALITAGADVDAALAPVLGHQNRVRRTVSDLVNRSGNEGATAVADRAGLPTVWVAETDACVHCLAYAGRVAKPGGAFPGGLTYGAKSYYPDAVASPPRHPNCRCTVEPLSDQSYADALRREADRSVLRGFSLESESMAVRVDAARRLVASDPDAPASVVRFAERAVRFGKFPTRGRGQGSR